MGRGDSRSKKGKIFKGSYGNARKKTKTTKIVQKKTATPTPKTTTKK